MNIYTPAKYSLGIIARVINFIVPIKKHYWVMGADDGKTYRECPKYLLEYMLSNHPDYNCCFITRSKHVCKMLKSKGIPCELNYSFRGLVKISMAECIFTAMTPADILYCFKKKGRRVFYMGHGMPLKIAFYALEKYPEYMKKAGLKKSNRLIEWIHHLFINQYDFKDCDFFPATSKFTKWCNDFVFCNKLDVRILGYPRNDAFFQPERMAKENWIKGIDNKFIVTYMPTHRLYGHGDVTPTPFMDNMEVQKWMKDNNIVFIVKNHPNMAAKVKNPYNSECVIDITSSGVDPQVALYYSDVLVTDHSSVWTDYLILRRPVIFYFYDNFEDNDTGNLYDIREDPPGHICYSEEELFELIKKCKGRYDSMIPSNHIIDKYHKFVDGNSCERFYNEVIRTVKC